MKELTEAELANVENCGKVGFSYRELAAILEVSELDISEQFVNHEGQVYAAWMKGRMQTELDLRNAILREAKAGSAPMLNQISNILNRTDEEHSKLVY